jgi:Ca2+-binding RTX toxin-like protein
MSRRHHKLVLSGKKPRFETLEMRQLFAADITLDSGILSIQGSVEADEIGVVRDNASVVVRLGHDESLTTRAFPARSVREIVVRAGEGDDRILNGTDIPSTVYGGNGNDILIGGKGADVLHAGPGDDLVIAGEGNDLVFGDIGDDQVYAGSGHDQVFAEAGNDTVLGEAGADVLDGGLGNDEVFGGGDVDWLYGGAGDDLLAGNADTDVVYGGAGDDFIWGGTGSDYLFGESGNDRVEGGAAQDLISGGSGLNALVAEGSNGAAEPNAAAVRSLASLVNAARDRWSQAGFNVIKLASVRYRIADLPGSNLALATREADGSQTIWLDGDAAGQGWFLDATSHDDNEFVPISRGIHLAPADSPAVSKVDLLTVLSHEMGHVLGWGHSTDLNVMSPMGLRGIRLVPHQGLGRELNPGSSGPFVESLVNHWSNGVIAHGNAGSSPFFAPVSSVGLSNDQLNWLFLSPNSPFSSRATYPYFYQPIYYYNPYAYNPWSGTGYGPSGVWGFGG